MQRGFLGGGVVVDGKQEQQEFSREPAHRFVVAFKSVEGESRQIEGYASTKEIDRDSEIIDPQAFKRSLKQFVETGVILAYHDFRRPIGKPIKGKIDDTGLWLRAQIATGTHPADPVEEVWNLIQQGVLTAFSIGFRPLAVEELSVSENSKRRQARRKITDLELFETSVVPIPSNVPSQFTLAKSLVLARDAFVGTGSQSEGSRFDRNDLVRAQCAFEDVRLAARRARCAS